MQVKKVVEEVFTLLSSKDVTSLPISEYNKRYIKEYLENPTLFISLYSQFLEQSILKLDAPIEKSVFVDYGGECGILSFIACKMKFKQVIYNDIYEVSVKDVEALIKHLDLKLDLLIYGDIDNVVSEIKQQKIVPDLICSFDVLEHIYNLEEWFTKTKTLETPFSLCFMTSANGANPIVRKRLKKIHLEAEFKQKNKVFGWKERDATIPFYKIREHIILEKAPNITNSNLEKLVKATRGLKQEDIVLVVKEFLETTKISRQPNHPTNTCDPYTGNWAERIIDLGQLKEFLEKDKDTRVRFINSKYGYNHNKLLNIVKFVVNLVIRVLGKENLFFSNMYTLEMDYKK